MNHIVVPSLKALSPHYTVLHLHFMRTLPSWCSPPTAVRNQSSQLHPVIAEFWHSWLSNALGAPASHSALRLVVTGPVLRVTGRAAVEAGRAATARA
jgi:hypothetical protein